LCDCLGFEQWGFRTACKHIAALVWLERDGQLPGRPAPRPQPLPPQPPRPQAQDEIDDLSRRHFDSGIEDLMTTPDMKPRDRPPC
jgi:hypothetical protein